MERWLGLAFSAYYLGLVPLVWLAVRRSKDVAFWWLAGAFSVSWLADTVSAWIAPWPTISGVYPLAQAGIVGAVLLSREDAKRFVGAMCLVGLGSVFLRGQAWDIALHTVAWLGVVGIVYDRWALGHLRTALLVYFGGGVLMWWFFVAHPTLGTWSCYQLTRLIGILVFCLAVTQKGARLRVA